MPRPEVAYFVINHPERFVVRASTKKRAAELAFAQLKRRDTSARALAARASPLYYCPRLRIFWFQLRGGNPRLLAPQHVPAESQLWVTVKETPEDFEAKPWDLPDGMTLEDCQIDPDRIAVE